jgi:hypothetical protein
VGFGFGVVAVGVGVGVVGTVPVAVGAELPPTDPSGLARPSPMLTTTTVATAPASTATPFDITAPA